ncbi:MAG: hypothetical protein WEB00_09530 [Dehalococcoidia bacterium]
MARMVRKQFYVGADRDRTLKRRSRRLSATEADGVRCALEKELSGDASDSTMTKEEALAYLKAVWARTAELAKTTPQA